MKINRINTASQQQKRKQAREACIDKDALKNVNKAFCRRGKIDRALHKTDGKYEAFVTTWLKLEEEN